jgi:hypothetical protein
VEKEIMESMVVLECHYMVAGLHGRHTLADGLHDAGALMAEHDGEGTFRVFAGERVGICIC